MDHQHYTTSQFAQKAAVTVRTLRFYDKIGLFSPSGYTQAGHRLYTDCETEQRAWLEAKYRQIGAQSVA